MAQHIEIGYYKQKVFRNIEKAFINDLERGYGVKTSMKYALLDDIDFQINKNDEVYIANRHIGKGFIWGSERGDFEIHFDKVKKKITKIYLVA